MVDYKKHNKIKEYKMKISDEMLDEFLYIMKNYNEPVFGDKEEIREMLKSRLETQGYYAGMSIRVFYKNDEFYVEERFV